MKHFLILAALLVSAPAVWAEGDPVQQACQNRGAALTKAKNVPSGTAQACRERIAADNDCDKDLQPENSEVVSISDVNQGGTKGSWESTTAIHKMKKAKFEGRSAQCQAKKKSVDKTCNEMIDALKQALSENDRAADSAPLDKQKDYVDVSHTLYGQITDTQKAMATAKAALDQASRCDDGAAALEDGEAQHAQVIVDSIASGGTPPVGPGTDQPDPKDFSAGAGTSSNGALKASLAVAEATGGNVATSVMEKGATIASQVASSSFAAPAENFIKAAPLAGVAFAAATGDPVAISTGVAETGFRLAGIGLGATIASTTGVVYCAFFCELGDHMASDDTPYSAWRAINPQTSPP
ncbi:MAG: hypothetical protein ACXWQE_04760 [Bdellovibrionales bacterium]